jgi:hypothetical protein
MNIIRKYIQNILCLASIGFVAVDQSTQAVEYLITTTPGTSVTSGTIAQDLNYGQFDTPQADQTYYIRLSYTSAEAASWGLIFSGNFDISIGDLTFGSIGNVQALDPDGNWPVYGVSTIAPNQEYAGNLVNDGAGWAPDQSPPPTTVHYLTLGQFDLLNLATGTPGTTQVNVTTASTGVDYPGAWNTGGASFVPTSGGFNINVVPEPSTMVTAALACAALGAVAAKKRKKQTVTA